MSKSKKLKPALAKGPGDIIKRYLDARGWTQEDLAEITGLSQKTINLIVNHRQGITIESAKLLSRTFENSPEFWLNLDNQYRLSRSGEDNKEQDAAIKADIRKYMPVAEIQKNGWVEVQEKTAYGYRAVYQEIWETAEEPDFSQYHADGRYCIRQNRDDEVYTRHYNTTWYRIALKRAAVLTVPPYDDTKLIDIQLDFPNYTRTDSGPDYILNDLAKAGVKFLYQKNLSRTYLDGASFFDHDNPVIVYTARYDRLDKFWFTLAHEIAHVLNHFNEDRELYILDNLDEQSSKEREQEADRIASQMLKREEIIRLGRPCSHYFTEQALLSIVRETGVGPAVVLGTLQHHGIVDYRSRLNRYKGSIRQYLESRGERRMRPGCRAERERSPEEQPG